MESIRCEFGVSSLEHDFVAVKFVNVLELLVVHVVDHRYALVDLLVDIAYLTSDLLAVHDLRQDMLAFLLDFILLFVLYLLGDGVKHRINDFNSQRCMEVLVNVTLVLLLFGCPSLLFSRSIGQICRHVVISCLGCWIATKEDFLELLVYFSPDDLPGKLVSVDVRHYEYSLNGLQEKEEPFIVVYNEGREILQGFPVGLVTGVRRQFIKPLVEPCVKLYANIRKIATENDSHE